MRWLDGFITYGMVAIVALRQFARVQRALRSIEMRVSADRSLRRSARRYSSQRDEFHHFRSHSMQNRFLSERMRKRLPETAMEAYRKVKLRSPIQNQIPGAASRKKVALVPVV